jgi:trimeric autotransporter adhesin
MARQLFAVLLAVFLGSSVLGPAATFTVATTNNAGSGSLRQAMLDANTNGGPDVITFNIATVGLTISPATALPTITDVVTIDGTTQPGYSNSPIVEINGASAGSADGLRIGASNCVIRGLVINRFNGDGIEIATNGFCLVEGNIIGSGPAGTNDLGNNAVGVFVNNCRGNVIGGILQSRNIISGNNSHGVSISGASASNNVVIGNWIGVGSAGTNRIANGADGINILGSSFNRVGGFGISDGNVISGNTGDGIEINGNNQTATRNIIQRNIVGAGPSGTFPVANGTHGVFFTAFSRGNLVGGTGGEGNVIAFNAQDGVNVNQGTSNTFRGNIIFSNGDLGIDLTPAGVTANDTNDVDTGTANDLQNFPLLTAATIHTASTDVQGTLNSISNRTYSIDIYANVACDSPGFGEAQEYLGSTTMTTDAGGNGAFTATVARANGRYITATATDPTGNTSEFSPCLYAVSTIPPQTFTVVNTNNSGAGSLRQAIIDANNAITVGDRIAFNIPGAGPHTISPLTALPVIVDTATVIDGYTQPGTSSNIFYPGFDGTLKIKLDGAAAGGGVDGLRIVASNCVIRGLVITRFSGDGIELATNGSHTRIEGNIIGLNFDGTDEGNGVHGVFVNGTPLNRIGGVEAAEHNVFSGNGGSGIRLEGAGARFNAVQGNLCGTDLFLEAVRANNADGLAIVNAPDNQIGGTTSGDINVFSGNSSDGIEISGAGSSNNIVRGNLIGIGLLSVLPNNSHGVMIANSASRNRIGGIELGAANHINSNGSDGVYVQSGTNNSVRANAIVGNGGLGIDIGADGITANDTNDADTGANALQNFPVITAATINSGNTAVAGTLHSQPNASYTIDVYASLTCDPSGNGEGGQRLGAVTATTDASGNASFSTAFPIQASGRYIAATATDTNGNTSEFSFCFKAASTLPPATLTVVNTNDAGVGSLREMLLRADLFPSGQPNIINFNIPGAGPHTIFPLSQLPTNREPVLLDGYTQPGANTNSLPDGFNAAIRIRIDGSRMVGFGTVAMRLQSGGNIVRGVAFTGWENRNAIEISSSGSNTIAGCLIGIDTDGSDKHAGIGVVVTDSVGNTIGGLSPADRNIISYNFSHAIHIQGQGASNNVVQGNFIGTDFNGTQRRANAIDGVRIDDGSYNVIGGTMAGARNLISGNSDGVSISSPTPGAARGNVVQGNLIGTDITGTVALGNTSDGIVAGGMNTTIGGATAAARNIIAGSGQFGIDLAPGAGGATVLGNWIGIGNGGTVLSNNGQGIIISSSSNRIGGTLAGEGNAVAYSRNLGVVVAGGIANAIRGNLIYANAAPFGSGLGIDLGFDGITANDTGTGDADSGPNNRQNFPTVTSASGNASSITIGGNINSGVLRSYLIDFFANIACDPSGNGEGQFYLGSTGVNTDINGNAGFNVTLPVAASGRFITATATDLDGNSSEFSPCFEATVGNVPMTFTVVNTNDAGAGSLRQAILDSNGHVSSSNNTIAFNIPGSGVRAIKLLSPLPLFTQPVTIDGFTQPGASANTLSNGNNATWLVELRGVGALFSEETLRLNIGGLLVRGLCITASAGLGIEIVSSNCVVAGCFVFGNTAGGIAINGPSGNRIGGTIPADRNVISGHGGSRGIEINNSVANLILGNFIGPDSAGGNTLGNQFEGVNISAGSGNVIGDGTSAGANVIAFHSADAVSVQLGTNNSVRGNRIFSNGFPIDLGSDGVTANDAGDGDTGPNNLQNFPVLTNAIANAGGTVVQGRLNSAPNTTFTLDFYVSTIDHFSGNGEGEFYLGSANATADGAGNVVFSATVSELFPGARRVTATATDLNGNTSEFSPSVSVRSTIPPATFTVINTNDSGSGSLRQALLDVGLLPSAGNDIIQFAIPGPGVRTIAPLTALPTPQDPVTIDGFTQSGSSANTLTNGNNAVILIRLDGTNGGFNGLDLTNGNNVIRGLEILRFSGNGIDLNAGGSNLVSGCMIWSNRADGIFASGGSGNRIGGLTAGARNVISANVGFGIHLRANTNSAVQGNLIGTDFAGASALGNGIGVFINAGLSNLIGASGGSSFFFGSPAVMRNVISGNDSAGIAFANTFGTPLGNRIYGNLIGTDVTGTFGVSNQFNGITVGSAVGTTIGGANENEPNLIAFNSGSGVQIANSGATNNSIRMNAIFDNTGLGIDLGSIGVTANDSGDADSGPNHLQNFPVVTNATITTSNLMVQGTLNSRPSVTYRLDFYANVDCDPLGNGEGKHWLGSTTVATGADGNATFNLNLPLPPEGQSLTATATDPSDNTSEFCACRQFSSVIPPVTYIVTNTNDSGPGSLRQAILNNNATFHSGPNRIEFNIPGPGVKTIAPLSALPFITRPANIDGFTQPGASSNTAINGNNAVWLIRLDGVNATGTASVDGLHFFNASSNVVRGLCIVNFPTSDGIELDLGDGSLIEENLLGIDVLEVAGLNSAAIGASRKESRTKSQTFPSLRRGLNLDHSSYNLIQRNYIGFIGQRGIFVHDSAVNNRLIGNIIGMSRDGVPAPIIVDGVRINNAAGTMILRGGIFNTGGSAVATTQPAIPLTLDLDSFGDVDALALDRLGDGVAANSTTIPVPQITSARTSAGQTTIQGGFLGAANQVFNLIFYAKTNGDYRKLVETTVTTDSGGVGVINFVTTGLTPGDYLRATAANSATNSAGTSEDSPDHVVMPAGTPGSADLCITKVDSADPVIVGTNFIYTITVTNTGPLAATNIIVRDFFPGSLFLVPSPTTTHGQFFAGNPFRVYIPVLTNGEVAIITLTANSFVFTNIYTNVVTVTSAMTDTNAANDSDSETTTIVPFTARPSLTIALENGQVVVRWTGNYILQSAPTVPFMPGIDLPSATSPYYPTQAVQQFFRLRTP